MSKDLIYLAQTDTTVGFLSQNMRKLNQIKNRDLDKPCIICLFSNHELKKRTRVPNFLKNRVRRAKKTTFLYPNEVAIRVVKNEKHSSYFKKFGWIYSTSANISSKNFNIEYAKEKADIIVEDERGFFEAPPSSFFRVGKRKLRRVR
jgi:tRNA A37 threonylcarbamoyladenosine synthetase subunit TsaC/SUA5/YrdC